MSEYTKTGLLFLMIAIAVSLCGSVIAYGYYSTLNLANLEGQLASMLMILMPIGVIGVLAGLMYLLGAIFIFLGRKEFGEKHRKNISYCIILFIAIIIVIVVFSLMSVSTTLSMMFNGHSQSTPARSTNFFRTQLTFILIQSSLVSLFSGLIWVLGFYNLEDKKGRSILLAAFVIMLLTPVINSIGSFMILDEWTKQGTLDDMFNATTWTSSYSQLITVSQLTGATGIIMLVVSLFGYLLLFVALYMAYKRISNGTFTVPTTKEDTYHR